MDAELINELVVIGLGLVKDSFVLEKYFNKLLVLLAIGNWKPSI